MMAILQHDVKKLLAYHSIENIGIIGMGIGLGIYGAAIGNGIVSAAGYAGALLHTLNHSLFKSLLFYSAGSVISQVHTQNIDKMGGLMKFMPFTAWAFLIGAVAISGIPPLNGFVSEFLIYTSLFHGLTNNEFYSLILFFISMFALVLIGGLALLCFTKVFSVIFLGQPRSEYANQPAEADKTMVLAKLLPLVPVVLIGVLPFVFVKPLMSMTMAIFPSAAPADPGIITETMNYISIGSVLFLILTFSVVIIRKLILRNRVISAGPTWGCGYTATSPKQQYTATSIIQEYSTLSRPVIKTGYSRINYPDEEIFPEKRDFHTHSDDFVRSKLIQKPADFIVNILKRAAVFQTGKLQHYVLYVLLFLLLILILSILKLI
jgi:NADH:ubiquinone oxidoreductase subunit 5 (subunit L)/multisubunit Na+/H+ antiporter MnhA subunit